MPPDPIRQRRSRMVIIVIALVSFVPFALAWYYARHPEWVTKTSNYGQLIIPAHPLPEASLTGTPLTGQPVRDETHGRWIILQVSGAVCEQRCLDTLHKTHQAHLMLNKEIARVRRLLLVPEGAEASAYAKASEDKTLLIAAASPALIAEINTAIKSPPEPDAVLIVDPLTNLAIWYAPNFDPYGLVKDLKRLLNVSQIG